MVPDNADTERCRKCGEPIEGGGFGSPEAGYEHPFSCPQNAESARYEWAVVCSDGTIETPTEWDPKMVWVRRKVTYGPWESPYPKSMMVLDQEAELNDGGNA